MNKAETKNPDPKITMVRVHPDLADEVKKFCRSSVKRLASMFLSRGSSKKVFGNACKEKSQKKILFESLILHI